MASTDVTAPPPNSSSPPPPASVAPPPTDESASSSAPPPDDSSPPPPPESPPPESPPPSPDSPPPSSIPDDSDYDSSPSFSSSSSSSKKSPPSPHHKSEGDSPLPSEQSPPESETRTIFSSHPKSLSHSPPSLTSSKDEGDSPSAESHSEVNVPLILGVAAGLGLFMLFMVIGLVMLTRKKRNRPRDPLSYYDNPGGLKGGYYNGGSSLPKWQNRADGSNTPPPGGGWHQPGMVSSDMSSGGFSSPHGLSLPPPSPAIAMGFNQSTFTYEELSEATNGFSQANILGQGGFGYVFRGILPSGKEIAVKQLKAGSGQGESEFRAEIEIISRVHHRHLVSLVGYCIDGQQRLLVYEFVANKTLEYHLYGKGLPTMDWPSRLKIALGSAKGLAYLHEDCHPRIIHRDIKAANILLDNKYEAMVADFGLARPSSDTNTHVSTRVMGTFGYLAPEYASTGKLTEKSDVFSFGVMLLELITGRRPIDLTNTFMDDSLVEWARPLLSQALTDGNYEKLVDPRLENNYNHAEMARMVASAAACVRHSAKKRPKMSQIVRALESDVSLEDLNDGTRPGQSMAFGSSSESDSGSHSSNMRQFRKLAFESNDFSNQHGGYANEMA